MIESENSSKVILNDKWEKIKVKKSKNLRDVLYLIGLLSIILVVFLLIFTISNKGDISLINKID